MTNVFGVGVCERRDIGWGTVELAELGTAQKLLDLESGCFKGYPLLTRNSFGKGAAYYCTRNLDEGSADKVCQSVMAREGVPMREALPKGVVRKTRGAYVIIVNYTENDVSLPAEEGEILLGAVKSENGRMTVPSLGVVVFRGQ
jgi:beta-galactosidase